MSDKKPMKQPSRRDALKLAAGAAALAIHTSSRARVATRNERPNILFLMGDQHRGDCIGADGNPVIHTPNLDRLGAEGARFRCAYTCTPSCTPARAALLTGLGPWRNGMLGYSRVPEQYPVEKPRVMRDAGYYTLGIGKMHFHPQRNLHGYHDLILDESGRVHDPEYRSDYRSWFATEAAGLDPDATGIGWNDYRARPYALPERLHPTRWTGNTAVNFLKTYDRPDPFFLKVSFARPHSPYDAPQRHFDLYEDADLPKAVIGKWAERYAPVEDPENYNAWHGDFGEAQVRHSRQGYYGNITFIDEEIGRILETLEDLGLHENTLVVYTADHGDMTGDHHLWRKTYAYEASARIPMLLRWPKGLVSAERGQVIAKPVELRDVFPTFMDAASTSVDTELEGRSMLDLVRGKTDEWRPYIDLEHDLCYSRLNHWNGLTDGRMKYIFHALDGEEQLFDLENDPGELTDLAPDPPHTKELQVWRSRMVAHLEERGDAFVKNGKLALRPESILHSPNYPGYEDLKKRG